MPQHRHRGQVDVGASGDPFEDGAVADNPRFQRPLGPVLVGLVQAVRLGVEQPGDAGPGGEHVAQHRHVDAVDLGT